MSKKIKAPKQKIRTAKDAIMETLNGHIEGPSGDQNEQPLIPIAPDGMRITIVMGKNRVQTPWLD